VNSSKDPCRANLAGVAPRLAAQSQLGPRERFSATITAVGSCCESCARAARATTCEPCAADVGALFGVARRVEGDPRFWIDPTGPGGVRGPLWGDVIDAGAVQKPPPPPPDTYTDQTLSIIDDVLGSPWAPEIAPVVRIQGLILEVVAGELLKGPSLLAGLIPEALSTALEAAGSMVELIPMIGAVISVAVEYGGAPERSDEQNRQTCLDWYVPPGGQQGSPPRAGRGLGTGSGGSFVPADFFVALAKTQQNATDAAIKGAALGRHASSIGQVLRSMSEFDPASVAGGESMLVGLRKHFKQPNLGVPADMRARFRRIRETIERSWQDPNTDGGVALWPFYLELFRREFRLGHLSAQYARFLSYLDHPLGRAEQAFAAVALGRLGILPPNDSDPRLHCDKYDPRRIDGALATIEKWRLKMEPTYAPDRERLAQMVRDGETLLATKPKLTARAGAGVGMMRALAGSEGKLQATTRAARGGLALPRSSSSSSGGVVVLAAAGGAALLLGGLK